MIRTLQAKIGCRAGRSGSIFLQLPVYALLFLFSCGNPEEKQVVIPSDIISKEKMAQVLTDIHIAEAEADLRTLPDSISTVPIAIGISFQKIFEKHTITKEQYDKSLTFYMDHPELLNQVYEQVLNELSKMQGEAAKAK